LEQLREAARLEDESDARHGLDRAGAVRIGRNDRRLVIPEISLLDGDGDPLGAVVFGFICCVAVLPGDTEEFRLDYLPTDTEQRAEDDAARDVLSDYAVGETYQIVVWRTYFGSNTHITDAVSGLGQWVQSAGRSIARGAGVLVGRIIHARAHPKKYLHDFTRHKRLRKASVLIPTLGTPSLIYVISATRGAMWSSPCTARWPAQSRWLPRSDAFSLVTSE
jgi:hypothetical protein